MTTTEAPILTVDQATDAQLQEVYDFLSGNPHHNPDMLEAVNTEMLKRAADSITALRSWQDGKAATVTKTSQESPMDKAPEAKKATMQTRPATINDVVGQKDLVNQIRTVVFGAKLTGEKVPHILLSGPAGHGKTTLAKVIASDIGIPMIETTGMVLRKTQDLVGLLASIKEPTVLFIDEVHAMAPWVQECLYTAMEDGCVDLIGGSGNDVVTMKHEIPGLVVVGATTRPGKLTAPMRDRYGFQGTVVRYSTEDLGELVAKAWARVGVEADEGEALAVAQRSKYIPRLALNMASRVRDVAAVQGTPNKIPAGMAADALAVFGISETGLDENDFRILRALVNDFPGKAVGLDSLAQHLEMDRITLADQYEPFLVREHYVVRTQRGRMAAQAAYELVKALDNAA